MLHATDLRCCDWSRSAAFLTQKLTFSFLSFFYDMIVWAGKSGFVTMMMTWNKSQVPQFIRIKPDALRCWISLDSPYTGGQMRAWLRPANLQSMLNNTKAEATWEILWIIAL